MEADSWISIHCDIPCRRFKGTGSLCLDRLNKIAYVLLSERSHEPVLKKWKQILGYQSIVTFHAEDSKGIPIYHTNVALAIGISFAILCPDVIHSSVERDNVISSLKNTGKEVILITENQMNKFCGNVLELSTKEGSILVMSTTAFNNFTSDQHVILLKHVKKIVHSDISLIEAIGGGSVRCTIAELF